ncbi:LytR/AlgR family response regulator transcription factor [Paenibacillus sp. 1P07SE]|uniref:LytR/AlgR family response regulator transcription factor n=1 Tax=Paenibacillus sp. 1P07SE TaxID=3132209 RepID=UPI0039A69AC3
MNILIVEDDPHIVKLLLAILRELVSAGQVWTTGESAEALRIAAEQPIDLFVLDIQLTDYKGTTLARQLRGMAPYRYTPIVFATALAGEELIAYREIKCYSFLIKPFTREEVQEALQEALQYRGQLTSDHHRPTIRIEQKSHIFEYEMREIVYIESFGKNLVLHRRESGHGLRADKLAGISLRKMGELLNDPSFVQCHKSYIINKAYLARIDKTVGTAVLTEGAPPIPIGQKYRDNLLAGGSR